MDDEIKNFIKVWITAITSLCYCYIAANIPPGLLRLLSLLPIICLFTILPFNLSSVHLGSSTAFFLLWLANFKLLLLSFDLGPLTSTPPHPLPHFITIACLPIKVKQNPSPKSPQSKITSHEFRQNLQRSVLLPIKVILLCVIIWIYQHDYKRILHPNGVLILYCFNLYLALEIALAVCAAPVRAALGFELEPQFNEPYLSTSLQDFWGRRWNLMVTSILRPTVYDPVRHALGKNRWATIPATVATFAVSGLMHELIYFHFSRVSPTWEVTWFFVLHGACTTAEVVVKRVLPSRWRLHRAVSGPLTVGFLAVTGKWLFFPQIWRNKVDEKAIAEYSVLVDLVKKPLDLFWPTY